MRESVGKTFIVALLLCIVCSVLVSSAAVVLRPTQAVNKAMDKKRNILQAAGLYEEGGDEALMEMEVVRMECRLELSDERFRPPVRGNGLAGDH